MICATAQARAVTFRATRWGCRLAGVIGQERSNRIRKACHKAAE
jgi:hypothetical protein